MLEKDDSVNIRWKYYDNNEVHTKDVKSKIGDSLLEVAHNNNVPLEGACEGSIACSTCHVICDKSLFNSYNQFNDKDNHYVSISDRENDMLDKAYGLTDISRLGCQIHVSKHMNNKVFEIPKATRNLAVDGYKPPKH
ncbi:ADRX [Hepatospora eriocheir]|uniref:2Fe-2S ferredoxin n=1 Tax=Hepatospora eriocheir TaxID=1081669 RepID=A0A1X0QIM2_9MICR|nr:ADRX [Hepatospora eriocheir]